jgi:pyruvate/2-oxoglutarate dehydrogenase complex dihydrolipoamide dehydrogenase (E3) component
MDRFDLVVIGGGAAGINAAKTALKLEKSVALLDRGPLGGSCINRG